MVGTSGALVYLEIEPPPILIFKIKGLIKHRQLVPLGERTP